VLILSVSVAPRTRLGPESGEGAFSYSVIIRHYGIDAEEIERTITGPLEESVSVLAGIREMRSSSEYGKCRLDLVFSPGSDNVESYLGLRDAVDRLYPTLPDSVQKPQILSSSLSRRPVFILAFRSDALSSRELRDFVDTRIKPSYEKLEGTGEIEVGGGYVRELHVLVDLEKAEAAGLSLPQIAGQIQSESRLDQAGVLRVGGEEIPVSLKARIDRIEMLRRLRLRVPEGRTLELRDVARVDYGSREQETLSRVDGEDRVVLYAQSNGTANLVALSRALRRVTRAWEREGYDLEVVVDTGRQIEESIFALLRAIGIGLGVVSLFLILFAGNARQIVLLVLSLPVVFLVTASTLAALGVSLDRYILAGLAVGVGMVIDTGIVLTEHIGSRRGDSAAALEVTAPLVSSALTTLVVLVPLFFLGEITPGTRQVSLGIALLVLFSLVLAILFIPPFAGGIRVGARHRRRSERSGRASRRASGRRPLLRLLYGLVLASSRRRVVWGALFALLLALGVFAIVGSPRDFSRVGSDNTLFVHIEMESGASVPSVDERAVRLATLIRGVPGVERVETIARRGNASMTVRYDPRLLAETVLAQTVREYGRQIPGGFVFLPEEGSDRERAVEITLTGDDSGRLRRLARTTAEALAEAPQVTEVVLHFKENPPAFVYQVDQRRTATAGLSSLAVASALRWGLYGPVAIKWLEGGREIDLRVMGAREQIASRRSLPAITVAGSAGGSHTLRQLGEFVEVEQTGRINRKNRQRAVYLTARTYGMSLEETVALIWARLAEVELPRGYAFELDQRVIELDEQFRRLWMVLGLSVLLVYVILAAQFESVGTPLLVMSILPVSLAFPALALRATNGTLTIPVLMGLIVLSGIIVNNSILIVDNVRQRMGSAVGMSGKTTRAEVTRAVVMSVRRRIRALLLTSGTTILGTVPLLLTQRGQSDFMSVLAFVVFWGILGSVLTTILFLPAVVTTFPALLKNHDLSRGDTV
jgi:multidrug efflux pump subunit AcrB